MPIRSANRTDSSCGELGPGYAAVAMRIVQSEID